MIHDVVGQPVAQERHERSIGDGFAILKFLLDLGYLFDEYAVLFDVRRELIVTALVHEVLFKLEVNVDEGYQPVYKGMLKGTAAAFLHRFLQLADQADQGWC